MTITRDYIEHLASITNKDTPLYDLIKLALRGLEAEGLVEVMENFNKKFSPGDDWFPEMRDALMKYREAVGAE